ncbi:MAG: hypothetical protein F6K55_32795 [Moorea sp. SIO4A3]|nr:hypothetical protein [Moorena sp. SIO4A3]
MTKTLEALVRRRWLSPEDAVREVVAFERRFGEKHLRLACHCGLLLILTPELVNLVRINFLDGENIPWIAESDLLLSSLCRPLQEVIYEVEPCVREVLLVELENKFGWKRPFEIAEFLWFYLDKQPDIQEHPGLRRTQLWIAQAYLYPDSTIREMKQVLDKGLDQDNSGLGLPGQGQIPHLVEILAEPLERTDLWDEYQYLVNTSRAVAKSLLGESQDLDELEEGELVLISPEVGIDPFVPESAAEALDEIGTEATIDRLIKSLNDDHYSVRRIAAKALEKIGTEATIDPLIKCLDDDHYSVRRIAASALGKIGTEATIDPLIKCLDDDKSSVRISAASALGKIGTEVAIEPLIKFLDDDHYSVRRIAASALGKIGTEATIDPLIKCLDDDHSSVRSSAASALGKIGTEATIDSLIKCLDDYKYWVRSSAAYILGEIGTEVAIAPLIKCLDDDDSSVRSSAAYALEKIGTEVAIEPLIKCLDDDHYYVRRIAAYALGKIGTEATIDSLIKCLDDDDSSVRSSAASGLGTIGTEATIDPLIKCLDDDDSSVRSSAASALEKIGTEATIDPLIKCLDDDDSSVRSSAASALGTIGTEATIDPLIKCLDDDHYSVRISAAYALEKIGTEVAIEPLTKLLNNDNKFLDDDHFYVRMIAASVLGTIGTDATIDPLIKLLDDDDSDVRMIAAESLVEIGTEATIPKLINLLNKQELAATNNQDIVEDIRKAIKAIQQRFLATQTIYILHLSDLHITTREQATLWSNQLAQDLTQDLEIPNLDALILSGDIANYSTPDEYQAAQQFLDNLRQDFPLDPKQIVIVPGNHDLNWKLAEEAYELWDLEDYDGELKEGNYIKVTDEVIRVRNEAKYQQRFAHFSQFYQAIKGQPYPLDYDQQGIIDYFPEQNLLILGLNSAWQLDHHFKDRASIHPGALSKALPKIRSNRHYYNCPLKIAVWHHPVNSFGSDRIINQGFIEQLAVTGFRFFLHGHIHRAETSLFRYDLRLEKGKLDGICAGTFGAPTKELIPGYPWQYNLLKIKDNQLTVYTRRREEANGAWKADSRWTRGPGLGALDYYSIEL